MLHEVIDYGEKHLTAAVYPERPNVFKSEDGSIPGYVGMELMAQAIAALVGLNAYLAGERGECPRIGLLLGARSCRVNCGQLPKEGMLSVRVDEVMMQEPIGVFDASVSAGGAILVEGQIKTIQPANLDELSRIAGKK